MMRPASEIHSALQLVESELREQDIADASNLSIVRDVLRWVVGTHWSEIMDGGNPWLVGFLLDDPDRINDAPQGLN